MKTPTKAKNTRSPLTVNKVANKPRPPSGFKTATGAQQYVTGKTSKERSDNALALAKGRGSSSMMAAFAAEGANNIAKIVGPKRAKTDSAVAMYNRMEARHAAEAAKERAAAMKKKK